MKTDPLHDPKAPPGPSFMPEYKSARLDRARELAEESRADFERGVATRETGDEYVRITVVLATVLLLTALAQRFQIRAARVGLLGVASVLLVVAVFWILKFPGPERPGSDILARDSPRRSRHGRDDVEHRDGAPHPRAGARHHDDGPPSRRKELIEIFEALVLAAVAILTAWSGYQAARWDAKSSAAYAARLGHDRQGAGAADAGRTGPPLRHRHLRLVAPGHAPRREGPRREVRAPVPSRVRDRVRGVDADQPVRGSPRSGRTELRARVPQRPRRGVARARQTGAGALRARRRDPETGDDYIRITVILATVLLLTALSQRFKVLAPRVGLLVVACVMLVFAIYYIVMFPRA